MPSPFPGMDPYLETPRWWRGFHNLMIAQITAGLNRDLPPEFGADAEERVYIGPPEHAIIPDILIARQASEASARGGGTAVLELPGQPTGVIAAFPEQERELFVTIRPTRNWDRIVTIIEILSPANKTPGHAGREEYLRKQREILNSDTHLMEIDLLRSGGHTVAAPKEGLRNRGLWDYLVCCHRSNQRHHFAYWFNQLQEPLPAVRVPLTEDFTDILIDLQTVFTQAYDAGPYRRMVDYTAAPPPPPFDADSAAWADALLREKGLR